MKTQLRSERDYLIMSIRQLALGSKQKGMFNTDLSEAIHHAGMESTFGYITQWKFLRSFKIETLRDMLLDYAALDNFIGVHYSGHQCDAFALDGALDRVNCRFPGILL